MNPIFFTNPHREQWLEELEPGGGLPVRNRLYTLRSRTGSSINMTGEEIISLSWQFREYNRRESRMKTNR